MTPRCFGCKGRSAPILTWMLLLVMISVHTMGCGTDEEPAGTLTEDQIQQSLDEAQTSLQGVGVAVSFEDAQLLADTDHFASPLELSQLEDVAAIESAIRALNEALDIASADQTGVAAAPTMAANETRLKPLIHLNLAYLYMLSAVSRCMVHGGDIYTIKAQDAPETPETEFYSLELKTVGLERLAEVKAKENPTVADFLGIFGAQQRQAIIHALNLMGQVEASVDPVPEAGIDAQQSTLDRSVYRHSSVYYWNRASQESVSADAEVTAAAKNLGMVVSSFFEGIKEKVEKWQFRIELLPGQ